MPIQIMADQIAWRAEQLVVAEAGDVDEVGIDVSSPAGEGGFSRCSSGLVENVFAWIGRFDGAHACMIGMERRPTAQ